MGMKDSLCTPDKGLAAVCGLFCPACSVFIATKIPPMTWPVENAARLRVVPMLACIRAKLCGIWPGGSNSPE